MGTFGKTTVGGSTFNPIINEARVYVTTLTEIGIVSAVVMYLGGGASTQVFKGLVYADTGSGAPGALKVVTSEITVGVSQADDWVTMPVASPVTLSPGTYYVGFHVGATTVAAHTKYDTVGGTQQWTIADTYADGPADPAGSFVNGPEVVSVYALYATQSGAMLPMWPRVRFNG